MSGHTPGRLKAHHDHGWLAISDDQDDLYIKVAKGMGSSVDKANARRLVACWNACEGFTTEHLENIDMLGDTLESRFKLRNQEERELTAQRDHFKALAQDNGQAIIKTACALADAKAQRNELLADLKAICNEQDERQGYASCEAYDKARATIAKVEP